MSRINMLNLCIDARGWGEEWEPSKLFEFMEVYFKAGYKNLPEKILVTYEQKQYLNWKYSQYTHKEPQIIMVEHDDERKEVITKIITPFNEMKIEAVSYE